ncbi:uncharacterized protein LOC132804444 [Ziziphus jujuba]|uniref:Uncharacterized protein LOC132804444 n=1 Tax=Ziziphus jujuba TaxID=326968 RepID=A0ABM4ADL2_ZIZJJ|nr:uncharacterized protein LOC132804444 [Ziziphus jujuba]
MSSSEVVVEEARGREVIPEAARKGRGRSKSKDVLTAMETKVVKMELVVADMMERLDRVEQGMEELGGRVKDQVGELRGTMQDTNEANTEAWRQESQAFQAKVMETLSLMQAQLDEFKKSLEETRGDWALCKRAATSGTVTTQQIVSTPRVDAPKPKEFSGRRDAKELDNYMWHMERYFEDFQDEKQKVNTATLYLTNLAAVWWRRKHEEMKKGICAINSWEDLKSELKKQFYPENVANDARKRMKELKHQRSICEYVEQFSGLMLQIPNMSEEDLLFNFMNGLQPWACQELQRRGVQDISTVLTMAETLVEYRRGESSNPKPKNNYIKGGGAKFHKTPQSKEVPRRPPLPNKDWKKGGKPEFKPKENCFLCDGPHWARDCPKRKSLSAMLEERETQEHTQMGCLQLLNSLKASPIPTNNTKNNSLMYVAARINGKDTQVMVDTGVSHNFIRKEEAMRFGLKLKSQWWLKTMNAEVKPLDGMARNVELHLGTWQGNVNFSVAPMDDFDIVLGMEFLREFNVVPLPRYNTVCIMEGGPCMIPTMHKPSTSNRLSAMQLKK